ncbi:Mitochondria isoform 1 [Chlorella sorokiniana]|uniref:Mitochondria isoform 1 n=1 Tax=Chlorella sorokiniana TaxID=3076 RepID=A0A2P6TZJ6_CHLSO|nr:Mitochondria isoform 1 [Chlorella sorokiniana]|eukprot:PRW59488.1 Mitochondria isoform 1 [Chlorella sorokiniana]
MQRGYFDDFRDFRDSKGKVFLAPEKLAPAAHAPAFPRLEVVLSDGRPAVFPPAAASSSSDPSSSSSSSSSSAAAAEPPPAASLVCVAFREGAQPMLEAWAGPFAQQFQGRSGVALYELAIVEGVVMRMWPFKQLLLRGNAASAGKYALPVRHLHHFGDMQGLREALHLTNLLTGYVFLVDAQGRLRWRGSGNPSDSEMATLLRCTEQLLQEAGDAAQQQRQPGQQAAAAAGA